MGKGSSKQPEKGTEDVDDITTISEPHKRISNYPMLENHTNVMSKCLNPGIWMNLHNKRTRSGFNFEKLIHIGVNNRRKSSCHIGVLAGDEESYNTFKDLLNPMIELHHNGYRKYAVHHSYTDASKISGGHNLDPDYVMSCRVSVLRAIHGFNHPNHCSRAERRDIVNLLQTALHELTYPFNGTYYSLDDISDALQHQLEADPMLCDKLTCSSLRSAGLTKDWPDGRGIWINQNDRFIVWINDKEHIRFIWREPGGNITKAFTQVYAAVSQIETLILKQGYRFQRSDHLGYILSCPSKLGTGMIAEVDMKLPYLKDNENFEGTLEELRLQSFCKCMRKPQGESEKFSLYLSNTDSLGTTEVDIMQHMIDSVHRLIEIDKRICEQEYNMEQVDFSDLIPSVSHHPTGSYPNLKKHKNLLAKCLTPEIYWNLIDKKTSSGFTLDMCIQTGVDNLSHHTIKQPGVVAGDEETYKVFSELLDTIIENYHQNYTKDQTHTTNLNYAQLKNADNLDKKYVKSCRISAARNLRGFCLPPQCTRAERGEVELVAVKTLAQSEESSINYLPINELTREEKQEMIKSGILLEKPVSRIYTSAGMVRDWPLHRGILYNENKNFIVWTNEKDHYVFNSLQEGGNMSAVFEHLCEELDEVEDLLKEQGREFMWNEHLGYITTCPSNLGTAMKASVLLKLVKLPEYENFPAILKLLNLTKENADNFNDGQFYISTLPCLGVSEVEQVQALSDGINLLIQMEQRLEKKKKIDDMIPTRREENSSETETCQKITINSSNYPKLIDNNTVMAKVLNEELYEELESLSTRTGFTVDDCIQIGIDSKLNGTLQNNDIGAVAGDEASYHTFAPLFDRIISEIHNGYSNDKKHPTVIVSKKLKAGNSVEPDYVKSCMISAVRCIKSFSLAPLISRQERRDVEQIVLRALKCLPAQYQGEYTTPSDADWNNLDWCFRRPRDTVQLGRDWPEGRGVWHNQDKSFCVMINQEDHFNIICSQDGCNMKAVFDMLCDCHKRLETALKKLGHEFMYNKHLGFIQTCPSRLGTSLHVGMDVKLPNLIDEVSYCDILDSLKLADDPCFDRNLNPEDDDVIHISNQQVLGISEADIVQYVVDGVKNLVTLEKKLANGETIDEDEKV